MLVPGAAIRWVKSSRCPGNSLGIPLRGGGNGSQCPTNTCRSVSRAKLALGVCSTCPSFSAETDCCRPLAASGAQEGGGGTPIWRDAREIKPRHSPPEVTLSSTPSTSPLLAIIHSPSTVCRVCMCYKTQLDPIERQLTDQCLGVTSYHKLALLLAPSAQLSTKYFRPLFTLQTSLPSGHPQKLQSLDRNPRFLLPHHKPNVQARHYGLDRDTQAYRPPTDGYFDHGELCSFNGRWVSQ